MQFVELIKKVIPIKLKDSLSWYASLYRGRKAVTKMFDNKKYFFVMSHGIGDVVWSAAFLGEYINTKKTQAGIGILCMKRDLQILRSFHPYFDFIGIEKKQLIDIGRYVSTYKMDNFEAIIFPKLKKSKVMMNEIECFSDIGMEMDLCYRRGCFQLPEIVNLKKPDLLAFESQAISFITKNKLVVNKTILLVPYINSRLTLSFEEWGKIARGLTNKGYNVYTNLSSETDDCIVGTMPLFAPLEILPIVMKKTGYVISGRCGLGDWLYINECRMSIIHTYTNKEMLSTGEVIQSKFGKLESFRDMSRRCGLKEINEYRLEQNKNNSNLIERIIDDVVLEMTDFDNKN